ncbi:MAG TPA: phosphopyruvate hydratase [Thermoprotei archaeon]|nr:phosphopyruvate hydratase [Thermoprotei archaeon]
MYNTYILDVNARKVFNSRGEETIEVEVVTEGGFGRAAVPSGASRGKNEVVPFPKGGIDSAIKMFFDKIAPEIIGMDATAQREIDYKLRELDGTEHLEEIGGATILATSLAVAKAAAASLTLELYEYLGGSTVNELPYPLGNVLGGGKHSKGVSQDIQEILVLPVGAENIYDAIRANILVHKLLPKYIKEVDPNFAGGKNDEGAWTANLSSDEALKVVEKACKEAEKTLGFEIRIGIDVAASSLWDENKQKYVYFREKTTRDSGEQYEYVSRLIDEYDLIYVEDPFHEEDFELFAKLKKEHGNHAFIVGDDLFTTNVERLKKGVKLGAANGIIIKPNQIGTLTDTIETVRYAKRNDVTPIMSHRSGETEDVAIAHLAVALNCPVIKTGTVNGERIAKLNELLRISEYIGEYYKMAEIKIR